MNSSILVKLQTAVLHLTWFEQLHKFKTCYSVPNVKLGLLQHLNWSSLSSILDVMMVTDMSVFFQNTFQCTLFHSSNLQSSKVIDNKRFWRTLKNLFSDKSKNFETITLIENDMFWRSESSQYFYCIFWYYRTKIRISNTKGCHTCHKWHWGPFLKQCINIRGIPYTCNQRPEFFFLQCKFI